MISIIILAALIRLNMVIDKPVAPAGIFAGAAAILSLLFEAPPLAVLISVPINFGLGFAYFWLLKRFEGHGLWWVILIVGIVVFLGLSFVL